MSAREDKRHTRQDLQVGRRGCKSRYKDQCKKFKSHAGERQTETTKGSEVSDDQVDEVEEFGYLVALLDKEGGATKDIQQRSKTGFLRAAKNLEY